MLKNLKVGAKLFLILVAPVVVLIVLTTLGVRERLDNAADASRVEELASFAAANTQLIDEIEKESVATAVYLASAGTVGQDVLTQQRTATDQAIADYNASVEEVDPGGEGPDVEEAVGSAAGRLELLEVNRRSIDGLQTDPVQGLDNIDNIVDDLVAANLEVAKATNNPELARGLASFGNMASVKAATAREAAFMTIPVQQRLYNKYTSPTDVLPCGIVVGEAEPLPPADDEECRVYTDISNAQSSIDQSEQIFNQNATPDQRPILGDAQAGTDFGDFEDQILRAADQVENVITTPTLEEWLPAVTQILDRLDDAQTGLLSTVQAQATEEASSSQRDATLYLVGALAAIAIALILAIYVARATIVPLRKLTAAAYTLSTERLPALVERLRNPEEAEGTSLAATLTPIDIDSKDEIGQLADAFNSIQQVTVEVAEEQAQLLRKGIGDIFVNLARRNQTLLDRQIEFIDQLESNEEDPDQLDNLFKLDHLATRMRRNAESLLVLAGAEPPRRRGRPVALADVVRVAIGEVEDFARIQLLSLDDATVGGNVAVDLAHLMSELMENATHFSPPDTMVEIVGHRADSGGYVISVSDQGIGMSADQLAEANVQLARPPLVGLALSRSLGFIVIGRLASRFDVQVKLTNSPSGGVTALVTLPSDVVTFEGDAPAPATPTVAAPGVPAADEAEPIGAVEFEDADDLLDELLEDEDFEREVETLVADELAPAPPEPDYEAPTITPEPEAVPEPVDEEPLTEAPVDEPAVVEPPPVVEPPAPEPVAEEAPAPITAAGLVKRTPKKRADDAMGGGSITGGNQATSSVSVGQTQRSPEEVRKMLSRYRSGLNRGTKDADSDKKE
jgi:signal transduction histidine kinase